MGYMVYLVYILITGSLVVAYYCYMLLHVILCIRHCRNIKIPQYLTYGFNIVDIIWMLLFIVYVVMRFTKYIDEIWIVAALLYFFHSLLALDYLSVVE